MKPNYSNNKTAGLTLFEVLLVIVTATILAAILLPHIARPHIARKRLSCANNLKQVGLAYRLWAGDNNDLYPMAVSITNGGVKELAATGNVAVIFQAMSNELSTPKILTCPDDSKRFPGATNFFEPSFNDKISYFADLDTTNDTNPNLILSGDDNFEINGLAVKSGLSKIPTNAPIAWSATRHKLTGYITLADGSVQQLDQTGLRQAMAQTGIITNRIVLP